jgi:hypothetical protein
MKMDSNFFESDFESEKKWERVRENEIRKKRRVKENV